jgi:hypothetical protein
MMSKQVQDLRALVADESLDTTARRNAANLLTALVVAAVLEPPDDDAEVVALLKPWPRDTEYNTWIADVAAECTHGHSITGWPLKDARAEVLRRHKERMLLGIAVDETANRLERVAAIQLILDDDRAPDFWKRNGFTAEKMLTTMRPHSHPPSKPSDLWSS